MAKQRRIAPTPLVRSQTRALVRAGFSAAEIARDVNARFSNVNQSQLNRIIRQEIDRQRVVDAVMNRDKRRNVDLRQLAGCRGRNAQVRARITLTWDDATAGIQRTYGSTVILGNSGRLATILNTALQTIANDAVGRGYQPPTVTSAQTGGRTFYRIEYIECA